ncbi:co-chaperone DjlA [Kangiella sp. HZ709]|uniref:co-chaperone DjlA n=1 Tax=Kangiella sp. HZ709 TaxID=2666328 RepID=UPI0012B06D66|nr:co-chaperone DjlA [Kangiella sp. HZ709]MRX27611.1 co-chaperone DjlA [Kangiella sp. HZ709]
MGWVGKLIGGLLGFIFTRGPIGALLGALIGHQFDKKSAEQQERLDPQAQQKIQAVFFTSTFSIMGHIAKADGRVSEQEIKHAENVMARMGLDVSTRKIAIDHFKQGKGSGFDFEGVMAKFKQVVGRQRNLMQMFLEIQISMAMADGKVDPIEQNILRQIGQRLGFAGFIIDQLIKMAQAAQGFHQYSQQQGGHRAAGQTDYGAPSIEQAYQVLGVSASDDKTVVKKAYKRLMSQHHPDKLVSKGLPESMIKIATEKTQEIKSAYELVERHKGW